MGRLYELFIGFRYLKSKKSQGFISFNTLLSIIIVFIGVFILIVVISVMNGFQSQIKDKILDIDAHITISNLGGQVRGNRIKDYRKLVEKVKTIKGVHSVTPFLQGQALLRNKTNVMFMMIRGIGEKGNAPPDVLKFIEKEGKENYTTKRGVFIGKEIARNYGITVGKTIELLVPKGTLTAKMGLTPGMGKFRVLGYFKTGYYDFDTKLVLMSLPDAQRLYSVGDTVWEIGVKIDDLYKMREMSSRIQAAIGFEYVTISAEDKNKNLFHALRMEKLIMTIILFLVIISAGITIMGTLIMVVMEKRKAIGILKSMGAGPISIMIIFVLEGFIIGLIGTVSGVILGVAAALNLEAIVLWIEEVINTVIFQFYNLVNALGSIFSGWFDFYYEPKIFYKLTLVPTNVYYIDTIPAEVNLEFVVLIAIIALFLSTVAAIFPARSASRQNPVETIRYE
ncbi:MAG: FtsX-like permease family protein [bacterium]|nr:FtsX-like permease family protein [bacterium]